MNIFLTMTDIITSQNIDISFWITLYVSKLAIVWTLDHLAEIRFPKQISPFYSMLVAESC